MYQPQQDPQTTSAQHCLGSVKAAFQELVPQHRSSGQLLLLLLLLLVRTATCCCCCWS
jgi:hypothetical protein